MDVIRERDSTFSAYSWTLARFIVEAELVKVHGGPEFCSIICVMLKYDRIRKSNDANRLIWPNERFEYAWMWIIRLKTTIHLNIQEVIDINLRRKKSSTIDRVIRKQNYLTKKSSWKFESMNAATCNKLPHFMIQKQLNKAKLKLLRK